jgi:hypothetical protein
MQDVSNRRRMARHRRLCGRLHFLPRWTGSRTRVAIARNVTSACLVTSDGPKSRQSAIEAVRDMEDNEATPESRDPR